MIAYSLKDFQLTPVYIKCIITFRCGLGISNLVYLLVASTKIFCKVLKGVKTKLNM